MLSQNFPQWKLAHNTKDVKTLVIYEKIKEKVSIKKRPRKKRDNQKENL